uniref:Uncharacterized protein n=1 Tax=Oryza glumipatula TaxID=40148 RepID=A0A0E0ASR8_9ORYZ
MTEQILGLLSSRSPLLSPLLLPSPSHCHMAFVCDGHIYEHCRHLSYNILTSSLGPGRSTDMEDEVGTRSGVPGLLAVRCSGGGILARVGEGRGGESRAHSLVEERGRARESRDQVPSISLGAFGT